MTLNIFLHDGIEYFLHDMTLNIFLHEMTLNIFLHDMTLNIFLHDITLNILDVTARRQSCKDTM